MDKGKKFDQGKVRFDLIPPDAMYYLAEVFTRGAEKYGDRNWERGMTWGRLFSATMRHAWEWWRGRENDQETGVSHLYHAAASLIMLAVLRQRNVGEDNRELPKHERT